MYHKKHMVTIQLTEKEHLTDNVWAFRFVPSKPLSWIPGQFMRVQLPHNNPDAEGTKRWFTVSSAPFEQFIQISTRVTQSTFKQALHALPIGGQLQLLEEPNGDFIWQDTNLPIVFVAGGIGITPFRSILQQRAHNGDPLAATLIYGNRTNDIPFKQEFDVLAAKDARFALHYVVGNPLTPQKITQFVPGLNESLVYVSGPEPMVESLGDQLRAGGLPPAQLKQDFFPNYTEKNY